MAATMACPETATVQRSLLKEEQQQLLGEGQEEKTGWGSECRYMGLAVVTK